MFLVLLDLLKAAVEKLKGEKRLGLSLGGTMFIHGEGFVTLVCGGGLGCGPLWGRDDIVCKGSRQV